MVWCSPHERMMAGSGSMSLWFLRLVAEIDQITHRCLDVHAVSICLPRLGSGTAPSTAEAWL
jgi:hypothetical protein